MTRVFVAWPGTLPGGPHAWTDADLRVGDHGLRRFLAAHPEVTVPEALRAALVDFVAGAVIDRLCGGDEVHIEDLADLPEPEPQDDADDGDDHGDALVHGREHMPVGIG